MEGKDLMLLICEMLYLSVKGPSSVVNKFSSALKVMSIPSFKTKCYQILVSKPFIGELHFEMIFLY